ncbi:hypothetical protein CFIMG_008050RA00001 [Ceratocystis fimbriata CBS 114723]|uniref:Uncharacterized protein n=1 Tax=Ceratocystis fimbriata CBS 114723 TaxID=1035309 RepID=A0A2C5X701_9PEZI|nr:hypothetical protein CFIMG_008050RA00001 [Ceratocystis fimbriata CBS 114723]
MPASLETVDRQKGHSAPKVRAGWAGLGWLVLSKTMSAVPSLAPGQEVLISSSKVKLKRSAMVTEASRGDLQVGACGFAANFRSPSIRLLVAASLKSNNVNNAIGENDKSLSPCTCI